MTSGVNLDFIFACTKAIDRSTGSICQIISDIKSISSEKRDASEQVTSTCVDVVVLLHHRDHDRESNHVRASRVPHGRLLDLRSPGARLPSLP
jgi:hypothetical protein